MRALGSASILVSSPPSASGPLLAQGRLLLGADHDHRFAAVSPARGVRNGRHPGRRSSSPWQRCGGTTSSSAAASKAAWINFIVTIAKLAPLALSSCRGLFLQRRGLRRQPHRRLRRPRRRFAVPASAGHDAYHGVRVPGHRGYRPSTRGTRSGAGRRTATVLGFLSVLALFASISILSTVSCPSRRSRRCYSRLSAASWVRGGPMGRGVHPRWAHRVGARRLPGMDAPGGRCHDAAAKDDDMPSHFAKLSSREGSRATPFSGPAVFVSAILFAVRFAENALDFTLDLTAALALAPFALAVLTRSRSHAAGRVRQHVVGRPHARSGDRSRLDGLHAVPHMGRGIHVPLPRLHPARPRDGAVLPPEAEQKANVFTTPGLVVFLLVLAFAVIGIVLLATRRGADLIRRATLTICALTR